MVILPHRRKAFRATPASPGGGDPYFSNVVLLLHCEGANGSQTFTDNSSYARSVTANGNAQISTSTYKYGVGGGKLDGVGDYLSLSTSSDLDFGTGDFTIEFFINFQGPSNQYIIDYSSVNTSVISMTPSTGNIFVYSQGSFALNSGSTAFTLNQWYHIALSRSGGTWTIYRDGTQYIQGTGMSSRTFGSSTYGLYFGIAGNGALATQAHFDELRITKGVARYTSNFTAPTEAFPNS